MPDSYVSSLLSQNLQRVQDAVSAACSRANRCRADVTLVAVTKYVGLPVISALLAAGQRELGESRAQALAERAGALGSLLAPLSETPENSDANHAAAPPHWHMIGHLQRNKVKSVLPHARIIHSIDSLRLIQEIHNVADRLDVTVDGLIETNVSGEASKFGVEPADLERLLVDARACPRVQIRGLMTMAPLDEDPEHARPHFARLRELRDSLRQRGAADAAFQHLSMGMSQDFAVAVEEGATLVRVGGALFEGLSDLPG